MPSQDQRGFVLCSGFLIISLFLHVQFFPYLKWSKNIFPMFIHFHFKNIRSPHVENILEHSPYFPTRMWLIPCEKLLENCWNAQHYSSRHQMNHLYYHEVLPPHLPNLIPGILTRHLDKKTIKIFNDLDPKISPMVSLSIEKDQWHI